MAVVLTTRVEIEAPAERVWAILADLDGYPQWNFVTPRIETDFVVGHPIVVHYHFPSRGIRREINTLYRWAPGEELRWGMTVGPAWLLRVERVQRVEPLGDDRCRYVNEVVFTGLLSPFVGYGDEIKRGFDRIGAALASRAGRRRVTGQFVFRGRFDPPEPLARLPADRALNDKFGYDHLITTSQSPTPREPVDKFNWQPCHACAAVIPVVFDDRIVRPDRFIEATGTLSYVCPYCCATSVGSEPDHELFDAQNNCHVCAHELGNSLVCSGCGMPRYWTVVECPTCDAKQAVEVPHLAQSCDTFILDCVACETRFVSLCIC